MLKKIFFSEKARDPSPANTADNEVILEVDTKSITYPWQLSDFLNKSLRKFTDSLQIDVASYQKLAFEFGDLERDLALLTVVSANSYVYFTAQEPETVGKFAKEWNFNGTWGSEASEIINAWEWAKSMQSTPPNVLNTEQFVEETKLSLASLPTVTIKEIKGEDLDNERLGLIRAVGAGSSNAPRLLMVEYKGVDDKNWIALVGKGICFDAGGLNIKTGSHMRYMKFDMSGGAVAVAVLRALAANKSQQNVVALIPLAENFISENSFRPDDVIDCRNGLSIEIDNTDAEGRLVLADAISYASDLYHPKEIISIATLTGAIGYSLGTKYGGAWTDTDEQWSKLLECSIKSSEFIWRMPMDDFYLKPLKTSRVADLKNSCNDPLGSSNRAARFLKVFANHRPFIHLDIANISHDDKTGDPFAPLVKTLYFYLFK